MPGWSGLPSVFVWLPVALAVAPLMDLWAALLHGAIWHGRLWPVHRSHHTARRGAFERNDWLSALHAPISVALILYGCRAAPSLSREVAFGVGLGMSLFGLAYTLVHDGLVHGRLPVRGLLRFAYFRDVARAHRVHHAGPTGGPPYGLFFGPMELSRHRRLTRSRSTPSGRPRAPKRPPATDRARA